MAPDESDPFATSRLSPVPIEPRACALPYGLTSEDLGACIPGFAAARSGARVWNSHAKRGLHGGRSSCVLSLGYPCEDGLRAETVFVKEVADPAAAEAAKYRFLEARGVPLPRLLHVVSHGESEVLLLEFLPTIGVTPDEADDLLRLIAQLNALGDPPSDLFQPRTGAPREEFDDLLEAVLTALSKDPGAPVRVEPESWLCAYRRAGDAAATLPTALNHGELYFQQVGWSRTRQPERLVMFDLGTMALLPRFSDVANVLAPLAARAGREQRELFAIYLTELCDLTGVGIAESEAWEELRLVRAVASCQSLPWLTASQERPEIRGILATTLQTLHDDLKALGPLD